MLKMTPNSWLNRATLDNVAQDCFRRVCLVFGGTQFRLDTLDLKGAEALLDALAS